MTMTMTMLRKTTTARILAFLLLILAAISFTPNGYIHRIAAGGKAGLASSTPCGCLDVETNNKEAGQSESGGVSSLLQRPQGDSSSFYLYQPRRFSCDANTWSKLCPPVWDRNDKNKNLDVTVVWTNEDCPQAVAKAMLQSATVPGNNGTEKDMIDALTESLEVFRSFCQEGLTLSRHDDRASDIGDPTSTTMYKARLLATRGPTGTKCPQWHIDHVPVRWVQCMVGPGCNIVASESGVNWNAVNGLDEEDDDNDAVYDSVEERNNALVDNNIATMYATKEQEAALLLGNRWNECSKESLPTVRPVVHKSPSRIAPWQGRVLLTQDIMMQE